MSDAPERIWAEVFRRDEGGHTLTIAGDYPLHKEDSVEYIRADLARPKVKTLEWWQSDTGDWCADTLVGRYQVAEKLRGQWWSCSSPHGPVVKRPEWDASDFKSVEEAKAAAQADYERRILAAINRETNDE